MLFGSHICPLRLIWTHDKLAKQIWIYCKVFRIVRHNVTSGQTDLKVWEYKLLMQPYCWTKKKFKCFKVCFIYLIFMIQSQIRTRVLRMNPYAYLCSTEYEERFCEVPSIKLSELAQVVMLLTCIWQVPIPNLDKGTLYPISIVFPSHSRRMLVQYLETDCAASSSVLSSSLLYLGEK